MDIILGTDFSSAISDAALADRVLGTLVSSSNVAISSLIANNKIQESKILDVGSGNEKNRKSRNRPIVIRISRLSSGTTSPISFQLGKARIYGRLIWFRISSACSCHRIISFMRVFAIYKESSEFGVVR